MRVEQLMTKKVTSCRPGDTLARAAQLMWDNDCGCLPACQGDGANRIAGIITDRDICMSALFNGKPLHELHVRDALSRQVQFCRPGDSLDDVERILSESQVRRLPVVNDQDELVGIITLADLAREAARESHLPQHEVSEAEIGDTLATICQSPERQLAT